MNKLIPGLALIAFMTTGLTVDAEAQSSAPLCSELVWSAQVLAANPDIAESCLGVYERDGALFAKSEIELTRVRGNRLTFRPLRRDGSKGKARSITVPGSWRAAIDGRSYRASELSAGQVLNVFIPEDRFALAVDDGAFEDDDAFIAIENAAVVTQMPRTASPLFILLATAVGLLFLGITLTNRRRRG